ncbi:MAG: S-adenosylmethionine:tRNA ribosyltransferase-isomerase, partial [Atribacterota bacterium]
VAAPTAGLHFTPGLLDGICQRGIQVTTLTLHVGMGTFLPVKSPYLEGHIMHTERFVIGALSAQLIREAKKKGQRIIAVGTTVVRVLETLRQRWGEIREGEGTTDIFISPGFQFQVIDALITNFHVTRSTLFMLVCAFGTTEFLKKAYWEAVQERYRFYSFGDATFIY